MSLAGIFRPRVPIAATVALVVVAASCATLAGLAVAFAPALLRNTKAHTKSLKAGVLLKDEIDKRTALMDELMDHGYELMGVAKRSAERLTKSEAKAKAAEIAPPSKYAGISDNDPRLKDTPRVMANGASPNERPDGTAGATSNTQG